MNFDFCKIYPITDTRLSGLSHLDQVKKLVAGGASCIQIREKYAPPRAFYSAAKAVIQFAKSNNVRIIINDRVDIAFTLRAGGLHLGQDDLPPKQAREILGKDAIIGFSTHSMEQARAAADMPIDYIAIGPIFPTSTKEHPDALVGLDGLSAVREVIGDIPLIAIGGINSENLLSVLSAGADSVAMIGELISDRRKITSQLQKALAIAN